MKLTEAGQAYRERCTRILTDIEESERVVTELNARPGRHPEADGADLFRRVSSFEGHATSLHAAWRLAASWLAGAPAYFQRHKVPLKPEDLTHHNCLLYTEREPKDQ